MSKAKLRSLQKQVASCTKCPRLIRHCQKIAKEKRAAYRNEEYWGRPVPAFGDLGAKLIIIGLAPAAHGANRTGRMFTGDRSGDWLYRALHKAGFANQAESRNAKDGLRLFNCYISAAAKCAPPDNKPTKDELKRCVSYLREEKENLTEAKVYLALGGIALNAIWPIISTDGEKKPKFGHGVHAELRSGIHLLLSYHPSQQNTFTKRLTEPMFDSIFKKANQLIG